LKPQELLLEKDTPISPLLISAFTASVVAVLLVIPINSIKNLVCYISIYLQCIYKVIFICELFTKWYLSANYLQIDTISKLDIIILLQNLFYLCFTLCFKLHFNLCFNLCFNMYFNLCFNVIQSLYVCFWFWFSFWCFLF